MSLVLWSQLPPNSGNHRDIPHSTPHRYPTHSLSHNHMCIYQEIGNQRSSKITFIHTDSTCHWFYDLNFPQTPARERDWKDTQHIFGHTTTICEEIGCQDSLVVCPHLPGKSFNHRDIPDSSPSRYPTHILSHNHCHPMCDCPATGRLNSFKFTFIHTDSTFRGFYVLKFSQSPVIIQISRTPVHTCIPHIFCPHIHCHGMCICPEVGTQKSLKFTFIQRYPTHIRSHNHYLWRNGLSRIAEIHCYMFTPHIFCHTTTTITCVLLQKWADKASF